MAVLNLFVSLLVLFCGYAVADYYYHEHYPAQYYGAPGAHEHYRQKRADAYGAPAPAEYKKDDYKPDPYKKDDYKPDPYKKDDYKPDPYKKDDYKPDSYKKEEYKTEYDPKIYFVEYVITTKGKNGGTYDLNPAYPWKADCNGYPYGYKYGWITAIWDDYEFKGVDYIKCSGPKAEGYDAGSYYGYKLDLYDNKLLDFYDKSYSTTPASYGGDKSSYYGGSYGPECYKGYILTALWSDDYDFKNIKYGKCTRLDYGIVDYSYCENFDTNYKQGGTYEAYKKWNVECPQNYAAVGLKIDEYYKIQHLRCCRLALPPKYPSPPPKY